MDASDAAQMSRKFAHAAEERERAGRREGDWSQEFASPPL